MAEPRDGKKRKARDEKFLINNPEAITTEDLEQGMFKLSNFWMRVADREALAASKDSEMRRLATAIESTIRETDFDEVHFATLLEQLIKLKKEYGDAFIRDRKKSADLEEQMRPLMQTMNSLLLLLYKKLRAMGFQHYPDLTI